MAPGFPDSRPKSSRSGAAEVRSSISVTCQGPPSALRPASCQVLRFTGRRLRESARFRRARRDRAIQQARRDLLAWPGTGGSRPDSPSPEHSLSDALGGQADAERSGTRHDYSSRSGTFESNRNPWSAELRRQLCSALGSTPARPELREHERLPANGGQPRREGAPRKREHEERGARAQARAPPSRMPARNSASCSGEVPDAVGNGTS